MVYGKIVYTIKKGQCEKVKKISTHQLNAIHSGCAIKRRLNIIEIASRSGHSIFFN
jgi:hypothetical protein